MRLFVRRQLRLLDETTRAVLGCALVGAFTRLG